MIKCKKQGIKISYSCIISKRNAAILPPKIQMRRVTMNALSIIDGLMGISIWQKTFKKTFNAIFSFGLST